MYDFSNCVVMFVNNFIDYITVYNFAFFPWLVMANPHKLYPGFKCSIAAPFPDLGMSFQRDITLVSSGNKQLQKVAGHGRLVNGEVGAAGAMSPMLCVVVVRLGKRSYLGSVNCDVSVEVLN